MELTPKQQTVEVIRQAQRILLLARPSHDGDAIGSLLGLGLSLRKIGKEVAMVSPEPVAPHLSFLPNLSEVSQEFSGTRDLIISLDLAKTPVAKMSYRKNTEDNKLEILITPQKGMLEKEALDFTQSPFRFDAVIILDTPDLEQLGNVYDAHTQLFFEKPVVNIDHHAGNDYFGRVNWVDLTATSTAEILVSLIESLGGANPLWDADIATALLGGLLWDTQSFQSESTTPKSLTVAAQLIALGGRQQEIVRSLFKTRPLSSLKLLGSILSNLNVDEEHRFVWAEVLHAELAKSGARTNEIGTMMDELVKNAPGVDLALIMVEESKEKTAVLLQGLQKQANVAELAKQFGGGGSAQRALVSLTEPLSSARDKVLAAVREFQQKQIRA